MASKDQESNISIPNPLGSKLGLNAAWITDQQFACYAFGNAKLNRAMSHTPLPIDVNVVGADFIFEDTSLREMLTKCSRIFYELQRQRYGVSENREKSIDFVQISQKYRSNVRTALDKMNLFVLELPDDEPCRAAYSNLVRLFYSIECTWHLLEFLVIDTNSSGSIVSSLLEWIRFHFPDPERAATEMLQTGREQGPQDNYWPVVKGLILQGQTTIARALLRVHSSSETHCFQVAEQLLQSIPIYSVYSGLSVHRYKTQWQCWCDNVRTLIASGNFGAEPKLEELMRLVSGDRKAWAEQFESSSCWYEYFPAYLLYTDSSCKYYQLGQYANDWVALFMANSSAGARQLKFLDKLVLSVMENNLVFVLQQVQMFPDNGWFAVHIVDLLYHAGLLESGTPSGDEPLPAQPSRGFDIADGKLVRESLLFDFGSLLMSQHSFWQVGMDYLEFSSTEGLGALEHLLSRVPFKTERQAAQIIAVAQKHNYPDVKTQVCKVLTKRNLALKNYGNALDWAIHSGDSAYVRDVANLFLEHYCNHGQLLCEKQIDHLGAKVFVSSRLVFLKKYYDFRKFYREQAYAKAAELLVSLMDSKIMPSYFWPCLMSDAIPLLEFKEPIIPSKETFVILEHLQMDLVPMLEQRRLQRQRETGGVSTSNGEEGHHETEMDSAESGNDAGAAKDHDQTALIPKFSSNLLNNCTEDLIKMLRLACARNLSRALIIENTASG